MPQPKVARVVVLHVALECPDCGAALAYRTRHVPPTTEQKLICPACRRTIDVPLDQLEVLFRIHI